MLTMPCWGQAGQMHPKSSPIRSSKSGAPGCYSSLKKSTERFKVVCSASSARFTLGDACAPLIAPCGFRGIPTSKRKRPAALITNRRIQAVLDTPLLQDPILKKMHPAPSLFWDYKFLSFSLLTDRRALRTPPNFSIRFSMVFTASIMHWSVQAICFSFHYHHYTQPVYHVKKKMKFYGWHSVFFILW